MKKRRVSLYMLYLFKPLSLELNSPSRLLSVSKANLPQSLPRALWQFLCAFIQDHVNSGNNPLPL